MTDPQPAGRAESPRELLLLRAVEWFAEHGVLDTSMRTLAAGIGTSNRMLNYHFGAREDLLAAVVEEVCRGERRALAECLAAAEDPFAAGEAYWVHVADRAAVFAPLFYELSAHAMYGKAYAESLREVLVHAWLDGFTAGFSRVTSPEHAGRLAGLSLAVGRGVLFDTALTGDRGRADALVAEFTAMARVSVRVPRG